MAKVIQIHPDDNVAVALESLTAGEIITLPGESGDQSITVLEAVPQGHKLALRNLEAGEDVNKYGSPIGTARTVIPVGGWVHTHNVQTRLAGKLEYTYTPAADTAVKPLSGGRATFFGYRRADGQVGIRNEIWIIPTVSCTNQTATLIAEAARKILASEPWGERVDGIYEFKHPYGCSQLGDDHQTTQKLLAALVQHSNAAGVLVLGLGCENNNIPEFKKVLGSYDPERVKFLVAQEVADEVAAGTGLVVELARHAAEARREELPLASIRIGLKCGGSDGFSGITANPLVGRISDALIAVGGSSVLTEVPEMFGAEHLLMNRARDAEVFSRIVTLINDFKEYFLAHNQPVYENPSPGNKAGGITTLEDKSLGCTQKGGYSKVVDVLAYGDRLQVPGLNLLYSPGNDMVASTALAAAGCQLVLFTTGRGTPLGTCVPTLKIATNSELARHKANWMDFNAGVLVEGAAMEETATALLDEIIAVASGEKLARNEEMGFREIAILKSGVTL